MTSSKSNTEPSHRVSQRTFARGLVAVLLISVIGGCAFGPARPSVHASSGRIAYATPSAYISLRGDPTFDRASLTAEARIHHERLLREIRDPDNQREILAQARSDDVYNYGRMLQDYVQPILNAFRVTGDLELLDHVDLIAEEMRGELEDGWRGTNDGTDGTRDGYLNWVYRYSDTPSFQGKDTRRIDEIKAHGLVAMIAYALDVNRDLPSPSGRDYAGHADFWRDYLVNHFEAKWRERDGVARGFPFMEHADAHTYVTWTKWHLYMGHLTGDEAYLREAHRMADVIWDEIFAIETATGTGYVLASNITSINQRREYLMSISYANSTYGDMVTFHFESFHRWSDPVHLENLARSMTELQFSQPDGSRFDTPADVVDAGIAGDVAGNSSRAKEPYAGIPPDTRSGRPIRRSADNLTRYQSFLIAAWDQTGMIGRVVEELQNAFPDTDTARLSAALLVEAQVPHLDRSPAVVGRSEQHRPR